MKKIIFSGFALMLLLQSFQVSANTMERPKGKKNVTYANVSSEIKDMLDSHDFGAINTSKGKVVITYYVDKSNILHISNIGSSNADLKHYVLERLNGQEVHASNIEINKENTVKLNFELGSN